MLTRKRWTAPNLTGDVKQDFTNLTKSISDYLLSLEAPGGTVLDELKDWTPVDTSGASLSFTAVSGTYLIVGRMVIAWGALTYPATASGSNAKIGGLPLTVKNTQASRGGGMLSFSDEVTATGGAVTNNTTEMQVLAAATPLTNATLSGDRVIFCVIYPY